MILRIPPVLLFSAQEFLFVTVLFLAPKTVIRIPAGIPIFYHTYELVLVSWVSTVVDSLIVQYARARWAHKWACS